VGLVDPPLFERAQAVLAQAAQRYSLRVMLQHLERLYREHGFLRASILRADGEAPSPSTYARHFASLDAAYQQVFRSTVHDVRAEVETRLRREVGAVESHEDFVVNRKFTVLIQPSVPVPHGYSQYWYFRPDGRGTVDITLGVPVSGPNGPTILGYLALPRLLVRDRAIRLFGSQQARLDMYGHTGLEASAAFVRTLVVKTPPHQRDPGRRKHNPWDRSAQRWNDLLKQLADAEQKHAFYSRLYKQYTIDLLRMAIYVRTLINNTRVREYLQARHPSVVAQFEAIIAEARG
jgi:hypothetical protein